MRYFFAFLATVGLIIIVIVLLLSGGKSNNRVKSPVVRKSLVDYSSTTAEVTVIADGKINADSLHEQVQIHVGRDKVTFVHIAGYNGAVVGSQSYTNTENSYNNFLHALQFAGFTLGSKDKLSITGRCALGKRYEFQINQDGKNLQNYWSTTCGKPKTYLGNVTQTLSLFQLQVPDYNQLMTDVSL